MNTFDLPRSRASDLCPIKALPMGMAATLGPSGLSCARSDGITGFAARGVPGLENAIHRRPARWIPAGVIRVRSRGRVALGARTGSVSRHGSLAGRLRVRGRQASGGCARGEQDTAATNRAPPKCGPSAWRGSPSWSASGAAADPAYSPQVRSSSVIESLPRHRGPSTVGGPATRPPRETG